jgi:hypothetical protein
MIGLSALLQWLLGDNWGETRRSVSQVGIVSGALFICNSESVQLYWVSAKDYHVWSVMGAYVSCVSGSSYRMYINSNLRDSRI